MGRERKSGFLALTLAFVLSVFISQAVDAATYTVINTNDTGAGSLRQAITDSNASAAVLDTIEFNIGGGPNTIQPLSALPTITDPVIIDGYTEPGASANTVASPGASDAVLLIEIDGTSAGSSVDGLTISAGSSTVCGLVINRFRGYGVHLLTNGSNTIEGNYIGTDVNGTAGLGNTNPGVYINGAPSNTIGGTTAGARNIISGNISVGVYIMNAGATGNTVSGNYIGTNVNGTADLGNASSGVYIGGAPSNTIGGTTAGARNIISGNDSYGVYIDAAGSTGNTVSGNYIGTDVTGTADLGNTNAGVYINGAPSNTIGGTTAGARNIISGNDDYGVYIYAAGSTGNTVSGNYIGTDVTGTADLGNSNYGVVISGAPSNTIGGTTPGARNIISGNDSYGVSIAAPGSTGNTVSGNYIGTDVNGTADLGNSNAGVYIWYASSNTIGGTTAGAGNIIAFNNQDGVAVIGIDGIGTGNSILRNSIHSNTGLGINLNDDGVTANDAGDGDTGANNLQNYPLYNSSGDTWTLNSTPSTSFRIEFFSNTTPDPSGNGEGETYLGFQNVTTDAAGNITFANPHSAASNFTATATDPSNNTSEFSASNVGFVTTDIDGDGNSETATDSDGDPSNGYETYNDPDGSSSAILSIDGDGDSKIDHFIDINNDGVPDKYYDPDNGILTNIIVAQINGTSDKEWIIDNDGDGCPDRAYNPNVSAFTDPFGIVFDSSTNNPIAGAVVTIYNSTGTKCTPGTEILATDVNPVITGAIGYYAFNCIAGSYYITVTADGYTYPSAKTSFSAGRAITTGSKGETFTVAAAILNIDQPVDGGTTLLRITKTANKKNVVVGDLVAYTVKIKNKGAANVTSVYLEDKIPAGFKYVRESARLDGDSISNAVGNRPVIFNIGTVSAASTRTLTYILIVGSGVQEGKYKNTAFAKYSDGTVISNEAKETVRVVKDPIFDLTTIIGKVFHDKNGNGAQDMGEEGIGGVKVVSLRGEIVTTDKFGRFHIAGVDPGRWDRGRNYLLKVDIKSLPKGSTFTTENPRVIRITRGLMEKINFGVQLEESPYISITQDRFLTSGGQGAFDPKLNLTIGRDNVSNEGAITELDDIRFYIYTNYPDFIKKYRISIYPKEDIEKKTPVKVIERDKANNSEAVECDGLAAEEYQAVLEVYDENGNRDESLPEFFEVMEKDALIKKEEMKSHEEEAMPQETMSQAVKLPGFGIDRTGQRGIIPEGGKIVISGKYLAPEDRVYVNGRRAVADEQGRFVEELILPAGEHKLNIVVKDKEGKIKLEEIKEVSIKETEFFYTGMIDLTAGKYNFKGNIEPVEQDEHYDEKMYVDGRAAFYLKGKVEGKYLITAYLDTEEGKIPDILDKIDEKDPRRIFRNLDPDKYYPVYGDGSTLQSDVDTQGKFYAKVEWDKSHVMWGNYNTQITGTELARYNRSLYGVKVYLESKDETKFGDTKNLLTGFAAEPQSLQDHNEFLSTGGSLYYLRHQGAVEGSEKVSIEVRDKDSGMLKNTATLTAGADYDINYYQGRILLNSPLSTLVASGTIISSSLANGDQLWLVVDYEYDGDWIKEKRDLTGGIRAFTWLNDYLGLGATYVKERREDTDYGLLGVDGKIKLYKGTYTDIEYALSEESQIPGLISIDGGLSFNAISSSQDSRKGSAYKIRQRVDFGEITEGKVPLKAEAYYINREKGFSSLGQETENNTEEYGAEMTYELDKSNKLKIKHGTIDEENDLKETTTTGQIETRWTEKLTSTAEVRHKLLTEKKNNLEKKHPENDGRIGTQEDVLGALRLDYILNEAVKVYASQQGTMYRKHNTPENNKATIGASSQITKKVKVDVEGFVGNLGYGGKLGLNANVNEKKSIYTSYGISTDRIYGRTETATVGSTYRMNDQTDIYSEKQFQNTKTEGSVSNMYGVNYSPDEWWNIDFKYGTSRVEKHNNASYIEHGIIKRETGSLGVRYKDGALKAGSRLEVRMDRGEENKHQYVTANSMEYVLNEELTYLTKLNYSLTHNRSSHTDDAHFWEISAGMAYRPINIDKLNMLAKYTYLEDLPPASQSGSIDVDERSHVASLEGIYDLTEKLSLGAKGAYKLGQMKTGRTSGNWYSSDAMLLVSRVNYHIISNWDACLEYRFLKVKQAKDEKHGALVGLYRHINENAKLGVGYNFTNFNDTLTDLSYDASGWFVNLVAKW